MRDFSVARRAGDGVLREVDNGVGSVGIGEEDEDDGSQVQMRK